MRLFLYAHGKVSLEVFGYGIRSEVHRQLVKLTIWTGEDPTNLFAKLARARPEEWGILSHANCRSYRGFNHFGGKW